MTWLQIGLIACSAIAFFGGLFCAYRALRILRDISRGPQ